MSECSYTYSVVQLHMKWVFQYNNLVYREDVSTFSQDKDHEISNAVSETELKLVEGSEVDKMNEESSPIKDIHQVSCVQEATHNVIMRPNLSCLCISVLCLTTAFIYC